MKVTWEEQGSNQGCMTVEVEKDLVTTCIDRAFKKVVKKVNLPGFRKGKVPRAVFNKCFGIGALAQDAISFLWDETYRKALDEAKIVPVSEPKITCQEAGIEDGKPYTYKVELTIEPKVTLGQYQDLKFELDEQEYCVSEEDVDKVVQAKAQDAIVLEQVEDGKVKLDHFVKVTIKNLGEPWDEELKQTLADVERGYLTVGKSLLGKEFDRQLVGMKVGEEKEVDLIYPSDAKEQKDALLLKCKVKLAEVKQGQVPELNDEFAKEVSDQETLDALRKQIRTELEQEVASYRDEMQRCGLLRLAVVNAKIDVPPIMIEDELKDVMLEAESFKGDLSAEALREVFDQEEENESEEKDPFKRLALFRVKSWLVIKEIAKKEQIEVKTDEVMAEIKGGGLQKALESPLGPTLLKVNDKGEQVIDGERLFYMTSKYLYTKKVMEFLVSKKTG
ncbi:MAG: hypothetical protein RLZ12_840 [Bacillota bacterium]|jgi:trigger factor